MNSLQVALLGAAHPHGPSYLKTLQICPMVSDIFIFDEDPKAVEKILSKGTEKIVGTFGNLSSLLSKQDIAFGIAALPTELNAALCKRLFEAGVHVFSEKPVAKTAMEIEKLVTLARQAGLKFGVAYINRLNPAMLKARQMIREGQIGRVTSIEASFVTSQVRHRDPTHWLFRRKRAGGGILSWLGCHYLDLMRYVLADEVAAVSMIADTMCDEAIDVEDVASVSLRFHKGTIGSLQLGYQIAQSPGGYIDNRKDSLFCIRATEGQINCDMHLNPAVLQAESIVANWGDNARQRFEFDLLETDGYCGAVGLYTLERFIRSLSGEGNPIANGWDAFQIARIVEAAYESHSCGRRVEL